MLIKPTRLAVGNEHPAALDEAADLGGLARAERDRMRQYQDPVIAKELAAPDLFGRHKTMLQAHVLDRMGELPGARSDRVILILGARSAAAPFLDRRSSIEQPLHAPARWRVEDADRVRVPPAVDQQGAKAVSYLPEIGCGGASPIAQATVFADKLALGVPQNETPCSAEQLTPHPMRLRRATPERGRQQDEARVERARDRDILAISIQLHRVDGGCESIIIVAALAG